VERERFNALTKKPCTFLEHYENAEGSFKIMGAAAEDALSGNITLSSSQTSVIECIHEINQHDHKQQLTFCEPNRTDSNVENPSGSYTDVEDTFQKTVNGYPISNNSEKGNDSSLDVFLTVYAPLVLLWFRRSIFGPANLIRSIVVGQLMRLVFVDNVSEWMSEKLPPWLEVILFQTPSTYTISGSSAGPVSTMLGAGSGKIDPHAWPPPAFTALALLTIFTLVVHPDGLTWIMLGKLREAVSAIFSALGQCWEFLLNDYGVFPTIIAAITLAGMFFIVFLVLRTLSPRKTKSISNTHNNTLHNERKKKKKKGGNARHRREHHHHHNHYRSNKTKIAPQSRFIKEVENASTVASPGSPIPSLPLSDVQNDASLSPSASLPSKNTVISAIHVPSSTTAINIESNEHVKHATNDKIPISNAENKSKENRTRRRMMSGSTLDTTPLSDDQSCGSTSVRSFLSVSNNSSRSGGSNMNKKKKKGSGSTPRRVKRHGAARSPKNVERSSGKKKKRIAVESAVSSRWDALKPEQGNSAKSNHNGFNHHGNGNTIVKKQNPQKYQQGNSRRGNGASGIGQSRKGRQKQKSLVIERSNTDRNPTLTIPDPSSGSPLRVKNVQSEINEVSPISAAREQNNCESFPTNSATNSVLNTCTVSSQSNLTPSPPPGFKNVSTAHVLEKKNADLHCSQHLVNNFLSVPTLFETPLAIRSVSEQQQNHFSRASDPIIHTGFFPSTGSVSSSSRPLNESSTTGTMIQENPFSSNVKAISAYSNSNNTIISHHQANIDRQIEADLQELGGQMAGSILDF
jgi:hypothetical protein